MVCIYLIRYHVLILPMRNGNLSSINIKSDFIDCSYPTYEEWKHGTSESNAEAFKDTGSYPTYEEWKQTTYPRASTYTP